MIIDIKNCDLSIQDGDGHSLTMRIGAGNLTWTAGTPREYILDRGTIWGVRNADEVPMDVKFDFVWEYLKISPGSGDVGILDAFSGEGSAATAGWISTDDDACNPYAVDIVVVHAPLPINCGDKETYTFPDFRVESKDGDLKAGTISATGKCNAKEPIILREEQSNV